MRYGQQSHCNCGHQRIHIYYVELLCWAPSISYLPSPRRQIYADVWTSLCHRGRNSDSEKLKQFAQRTLRLSRMGPDLKSTWFCAPSVGVCLQSIGRGGLEEGGFTRRRFEIWKLDREELKNISIGVLYLVCPEPTWWPPWSIAYCIILSSVWVAWSARLDVPHE